MSAARSGMHARFAALHAGDRPLLLPNAWDAASARLLEHAGAQAIATSSASLAWSRGYADGGTLPRAEQEAALASIVRVASVPVTADVEDGYGDDPDDVAAFVERMAAHGVVGINLEDGGADPAQLAEKIRAIRARLGATPLFVNARTDVWLRGLATGDAAVAMAIERLRLYADAGADGGFVPGLTAAADARTIVDAVPLAIGVMTRPGLDPIDALHAAGVRRVSAGPFTFYRAFDALRDAAGAFLAGDAAPLLRPGLDFATVDALFVPAPLTSP